MEKEIELDRNEQEEDLANQEFDEEKEGQAENLAEDQNHGESVSLLGVST